MSLPGAIRTSNPHMALEKLKLSAQALDREQTLLWIKALFFGGFAAVALGGYALSAIFHAPLGQIFCAAAGLFITVSWIATCWTARYWESVWDSRIAFLEDYAVGALFKIDEGPGRRHPLKTGLRLSVPAILMVFCAVLLVVFAALLLYPVLVQVIFGAWRSGFVVRALLGVLVVSFFAAASYAVLRLSRTATRQPPQGLIDAGRYLNTH